MIKIFYRTIKNSSSQELKNFRSNIWVYAINPNTSEIMDLEKNCQLEKSLINDALDPFEVPRIETEKETTYVFTRGPSEENGMVSTAPILIAIGKNHITTISKTEMDFLNNFVNGKTEFSSTQRIKFFIQIFSELNKNYSNSMIQISRKVRSISVSFEKITDKDIIHFVDFERIVNDFLSALIPTNAMLHNLLSGKHLRLYEYDIDLIEDLFLSNKQLIEMCESTLKNIVNIRNAYSTIMTQDTNRIIKFLTSLTIVMTIPTIIASIYGMNIELPFSKNPFVFFEIIVAIIIITYILVIVFRKKNWI